MRFLEDGPNNNGGWYDRCQLPKSLREMLCGAKLIVNPMNCYGSYDSCYQPFSE